MRTANPSSPASQSDRRIKTIIICLVLWGIWMTVAGVTRSHTIARREREARERLDTARPAAAVLAEKAKAEVARWQFRNALPAIDAALALVPEAAEYHLQRGHILASMFRFEDAAVAYRNAERLDGRLVAATRNANLCERVARTKQGVGRLERDTLYAMHRNMMKERRVDEAVRIASFLTHDVELQLATWSQWLELRGVYARLSLHEEGGFALAWENDPAPKLELLAGMPVKRLSLRGSKVEDLRALPELPLEELDLTDTQVWNLAPLNGMQLRVLKVAHTPVENLAPLTSLPLRELDASHSQVRSVMALSGLPLRRLYLDGCEIDEIRALATVPLNELDLSNTRITDLQPLRNLPIQKLRIAGTEVANITALRGAPLVELWIASTRVSDLSPLARSPLRILDLTNCELIRDLTPLSECRELEKLNFPPDPVSAEPLRHLPRLQLGNDLVPAIATAVFESADVK